MAWPRIVLLVAWLSLTREYSEEGEDETHAQVGLEIAVRLASSNGSNRRGHGAGPGYVLIIDVGPRRQEIASWKGSGVGIRCGEDSVGVRRCRARRQSDVFGTAVLGQHEPRPHVD